jgi:hypothetical protein
MFFKTTTAFVFIFVATTSITLSQDFGPVQELHSKWEYTAPKLDGMISPDEWQNAVSVDIDATDKIRPGVASGDSNTVDQEKTGGLYPYESNHAKFSVMNDEKYLYVLIDCTDDILDFATGGGIAFRNDGCEVLVDGNNSRLEKKENNRFGGIAVIRGDGGPSELNGKELPKSEFGASPKEDKTGWIVEMRWEITDFADTIGFDIVINDSDDPNILDRHAQYFWNSFKDNTYTDERQWGILHLSKKIN